MELWKIAIGLILVYLFATSEFSPLQPSKPLWYNITVYVIDVGEGDSILIDTPGKDLLIDGGRSNGKALSFLKSINETQIDFIVGTHHDADHIGGLTQVLQNVNYTELWDNGEPKDTLTSGEFEAFGPEAIEKGFVFTLSEGVVGEVLNPGEPRLGSDNDNSIVIKLKAGGKSFLFTADCEYACERRVATRADVLKVGHHGSKTSTSDYFVNIVRPAVAVVSVGPNSYGHPTQEVLGKLTRNNIETLRTDVLGTIAIKTDGVNIYLE